MKKLLLTLVLLTSLAISASAHNIRYFTYSQVSRTVSYLNMQDELMIYCGYPAEIETYVILNEVWAERVNSKFFEVWIFGYDGYTGEEVYMPVDLECVWLPSTGGRYYNAAQYLRFRTNITTPTFMWAMPSYNRFTRITHVPGHRYTYHWDIHRPGWRRPSWNPNDATPPPYHPYYMREPGVPITYVYNNYRPWTPGTNERPMTPSNGYSNRRDMPDNSGFHSNDGRSTNTSRNSGTTRTGNSNSRDNYNNSGDAGSRSRNNNANSTGTTSRNTGTTSTSRSTGTTSTSSRNTGTTNTSRSSGTTSTSRNTNTTTFSTENANTSRSTNTSTKSTSTSSRGTISNNSPSSRNNISTNSSSSATSSSRNTNNSSGNSRSTNNSRR